MITESELLRGVGKMGGNVDRWKAWYLIMKDEVDGQRLIEDNWMSVEDLNRKRHTVLGDLDKFGIVNVRLYPSDLLLRQAREGVKTGAVAYVGINCNNRTGIYNHGEIETVESLDTQLTRKNKRVQVFEAMFREDFWVRTMRTLQQLSPLGIMVHAHGHLSGGEYSTCLGRSYLQRIGQTELTNWLGRIKRQYGPIFVNLMTCFGGEMLEKISKDTSKMVGVRMEGPRGLLWRIYPHVWVNRDKKVRVSCEYEDSRGNKLDKFELGE
jgi:hypothetical protein